MEIKPENLTILSWAEEDRPREKLMLKGKSALSDAELIAILIGSGTKNMTAVEVAKKILHRADNDLNELAKLSLAELIKIPGIGEAKAISIVSALELGRRRKDTMPVQKPRITCSADVYNTMKPFLLDLHHEEFWILVLNRANLVLKKLPVSMGGVSGTVADPKVIFRAAVENNGTAIILVHNHPSGNLRPSDADIRLTKKMKDSGIILDMPVLDHVIFTENGYFSFADEGIM